MRFEFLAPNQLIFGLDCLAESIPRIAELGKRALLVTGRSPERSAGIAETLRTEGTDLELFPVHGEPSVQIVTQGVDQARQTDRDLVIGVGGGSAIDAAKAIAGLAPNPGDVLDYLEVIGGGQPLLRPALAVAAIPTTAGTGAEVTRNAVIGSPEAKVKVSLRSNRILPRIAVVDPRLTVTLPPEVTAFSGLDALTQVIEPFLSRRHNPFVDGLCREAIPRAARSLETAVHKPGDLDARQDMSLVSLIGGIALTNAGLGAVHGFAGPLGGMTGGPHGAICARLLPIVLEANYRALLCAGNPKGSCDRMDELGRMLTGKAVAKGPDAIRWLRDCCALLRVPPLSQWGLARSGIAEAVEKAQRASSMKGNPVLLSPAELRGILEEAID